MSSGTLVTMKPRRSDDSSTITPSCANDERFCACIPHLMRRCRILSKLISDRKELPVFRMPNVTVFCHDSIGLKI